MASFRLVELKAGHFSQHGGIPLGSTGGIIVVVIVILYLIIRWVMKNNDK